MSELKVYVKPLKTNILGQTIVGQSYYLKADADKVIAELEESNKMEVEQLLIEIAELKDEIKRLENVRKVHIESIESMCEGLKLNAKQICKTQRARCLAMAKWCGDVRELMHRLLILDIDADRRRMSKCKWCRKWHKRWLAIAEKFKEAK